LLVFINNYTTTHSVEHIKPASFSKLLATTHKTTPYHKPEDKYAHFITGKNNNIINKTLTKESKDFLQSHANLHNPWNKLAPPSRWGTAKYWFGITLVLSFH
jgi:hypothetical protein